MPNKVLSMTGNTDSINFSKSQYELKHFCIKIGIKEEIHFLMRCVLHPPKLLFLINNLELGSCEDQRP